MAYLIVDNWYDAVLVWARLKESCKLRLRPRSISKTVSGRAAGIFTGAINNCEAVGKNIIIDYGGKRLIFTYTNDYQLIHTIKGIKEQLIEEQYKPIDFKGKDVLDIGGSIGDSAIYFGINGAKSVITLEPYPFTYKIAKRNIALNKLEKKVTLLNQACRAQPGHITIDPNFQNTDRSSLEHFEKGKKINITTLGDLVKKYNINDGVLKIDCEGYEYEILGSATPQLLRKFKYMVLEYHFGYRSLEKKLSDCGFSVRHTMPFYAKHIDDKTDVLCGFIFAERST
jgi:FkbM family methyltransferase